MTEPLTCWRCGAALTDLKLPLARDAECGHCRAELYVCKMCKLYDPRKFAGCVEERAEPPIDKERANFCDWFEPRPDAHRPRDNQASANARTQLDALFGGGSPATPQTADAARSALEDLFKK